MPFISKSYPAKPIGQNICTNKYMNIFRMQKTCERISEYIRNDKRCRMNIRIYSEERKETNIYEYEYICFEIFKYIWMCEYSLHTASKHWTCNESSRHEKYLEKESDDSPWY